MLIADTGEKREETFREERFALRSLRWFSSFRTTGKESKTRGITRKNTKYRNERRSEAQRTGTKQIAGMLGVFFRTRTISRRIAESFPLVYACPYFSPSFPPRWIFTTSSVRHRPDDQPCAALCEQRSAVAISLQLRGEFFYLLDEFLRTATKIFLGERSETYVSLSFFIFFLFRWVNDSNVSTSTIAFMFIETFVICCNLFVILLITVGY